MKKSSAFKEPTNSEISEVSEYLSMHKEAFKVDIYIFFIEIGLKFLPSSSSSSSSLSFRPPSAAARPYLDLVN